MVDDNDIVVNNEMQEQHLMELKLDDDLVMLLELDLFEIEIEIVGLQHHYHLLIDDYDEVFEHIVNKVDFDDELILMDGVEHKLLDEDDIQEGNDEAHEMDEDIHLIAEQIL